MPLLVERWLSYLRGGHGGSGATVAVLLEALRTYGARVKGEEGRAFAAIVEGLNSTAPCPGLSELVSALAASQEVIRLALPGFYQVLAAYRSADLLAAEIVARHCVASSRDARIRLTDFVGAELWLQRARSLSCTLGGEYSAEEKALADWRRKTKRLQVLPRDRTGSGQLKIGIGEAGHLRVKDIEEFADQVFATFPFVHRIERVEKAQALRVSAPTLLGLDNVGRHVPVGKGDRFDIIPIALDSSYTGDIALRMNLVLHSDTTESQRAAARDVIAKEATLFRAA
jgi:hypothetical protein